MKEYGTAYVTQPTGYKFSPILDFCKEVRFITTGYEEEKDLSSIIENALNGYNPEYDVLVPVGSVSTNIVIGIIAERIRIEKGFEFINIATYSDRKYTIHLLSVKGFSDGN
jgi:hypothetical protein